MLAVTELVPINPVPLRTSSQVRVSSLEDLLFLLSQTVDPIFMSASPLPGFTQCAPSIRFLRDKLIRNRCGLDLSLAFLRVPSQGLMEGLGFKTQETRLISLSFIQKL